MDSGYCRSCKRQVRAIQTGGTSHVVNMILTLITVGFWLIPWLLLTLFVPKNPICNVCGGALVGSPMKSSGNGIFNSAASRASGASQASDLDPRASKPCHCGSGKRFQNCHGLRTLDKKAPQSGRPAKKNAKSKRKPTKQAKQEPKRVAKRDGPIEFTREQMQLIANIIEENPGKGLSAIMPKIKKSALFSDFRLTNTKLLYFARKIVQNSLDVDQAIADIRQEDGFAGLEDYLKSDN